MFQHLARRFLLRSLLGGTLRARHEVVHFSFRQSHLDRKSFPVLRPFFFHQPIDWLAHSCGLQPFLQRRLKIHHRDGAGLQLHMSQFGLYDRPQNKVARRRPSAIEIQCSQDRFQRVHQQSGFIAAAALLFAAAQAQIVADLELLGHAQQVPLPNQMRAQFRKMSFVKSREATEQRLGSNQAQDGISQELELFVITPTDGCIGRSQRLHLARLRTVSKRLHQEFLALEVVSQTLFQRHDVVRLHDSTGGSPGASGDQFFGGWVCGWAGTGAPPVSSCKRSRSRRAEVPIGVFSALSSTARMATFNASSYFCCLSSASASRRTSAGNGWLGKASIAFWKFACAPAKLFLLYSIAPMVEYACERSPDL